MIHAYNPGTSEAEEETKGSAQLETDLVFIAGFNIKLRTIERYPITKGEKGGVGKEKKGK